MSILGFRSTQFQCAYVAAGLGSIPEFDLLQDVACGHEGCCGCLLNALQDSGGEQAKRWAARGCGHSCELGFRADLDSAERNHS